MRPTPLYETIIVKLIFDLFDLLVRPAGDYLLWRGPDFGRRAEPNAIGQRYALDGREHGGRQCWSGGPTMTIPRGARELARSPAQPCIRLIREDHNHDAVMRIAAKAPGRRAHSSERFGNHGVRPGHHHLGSSSAVRSTGCPAVVLLPSPSVLLLLLMTPDARRLPVASRLS
jgi:hypothetical protein